MYKTVVDCGVEGCIFNGKKQHAHVALAKGAVSRSLNIRLSGDRYNLVFFIDDEPVATIDKDEAAKFLAVIQSAYGQMR